MPQSKVSCMQLFISCFLPLDVLNCLLDCALDFSLDQTINFTPSIVSINKIEDRMNSQSSCDVTTFGCHVLLKSMSHEIQLWHKITMICITHTKLAMPTWSLMIWKFKNFIQNSHSSAKISSSKIFTQFISNGIAYVDRSLQTREYLMN